MIDPDNITSYGQSVPELEERIMFWLFVAGKTAHTISRALERMLTDWEGMAERQPFECVRKFGPERLPQHIRKYGIGCFNLKARGLWELANSGIDLRTCSGDDLRKFPGIGRKTAKCFILHSRPDAAEAGLDTHILKSLRDHGHVDAPMSTPGSDGEYAKWEVVALQLAHQAGVTPAAWDISQWRKYRRSKAV